MHAVLRPLMVYIALFALFRVTGKRSIGDISAFDFVLLLVVSETVSSALLAVDHSVTGALLAAVTLVAADVLLSKTMRRFPRLRRILEDEPAVLFLDGKFQEERLRRERVTADDVREAARQLHGIDSLDQVQCAVLERRGRISIIPRVTAS